MDLIQRPKEVPRSQKNYLDDKKYQEYVNAQLNTIYNKIDEIIRDGGYVDGNEEEY